jgi:heme o synthase
MKTTVTTPDGSSLILRGWGPRPAAATLAALFELTKPRVTTMVLVTTAAGAYFASRGLFDPLLLLHVLIGTAFLAGGTAALNQFMERRADALMRRTEARPLPSGRLHPFEALGAGMLLVSTGTLYLLLTTNGLTAGLGWLTSAIYLLFYTPLKTRTPFCSLVGAVPGAVPPVMGWTSVRGELGAEAYLLFAILFLWQFPHILAIAWVYREDYERGGFQMLPVRDDQGRLVGQLILFSALGLLAVSLGPYFSGLGGPVYLAGAVLLGIYFLSASYRTFASPSKPAARRLLRASIVYLPLLLLLLTLNRT